MEASPSCQSQLASPSGEALVRETNRRAMPHFFSSHTGERRQLGNAWRRVKEIEIKMTWEECIVYIINHFNKNLATLTCTPSLAHTLALLRHKCHHCGKTIAFQNKYLKCSACGLVCHPGCGEFVPQECGVPAQLSPVRIFLRNRSIFSFY